MRRLTPAVKIGEESLEVFPEIVSTEALARLFDVTPITVMTIAARGEFIRTKRGFYRFLPSVQNYVRRLREAATGRGLGSGTAFNSADESAKLKISQRQNIDLKNEILRGTAIPKEAIAPAWGRVMRAIRTGMLSIPNKARFRLQHLTLQDAEVIAEIVRDQLEAAAATDTPPPAEGYR
jgi:phage terminase Nu1 subunit (DNA packaging protein)